MDGKPLDEYLESAGWTAHAEAGREAPPLWRGDALWTHPDTGERRLSWETARDAQTGWDVRRFVPEESKAARRRFFAALAMRALLQSGEAPDAAYLIARADKREAVARAAFLMADAMLAEEKGK